MFFRLLIIVIAIGLLVGGGFAIAQRALPPLPGTTGTAAQPTAAVQTPVQSYTGDRAGAQRPGAAQGQVAPQASGPAKVRLSESTTILKPATATLAELKVGDAVTVQGQADTEGNVLAKSITVNPTQGQNPQAATRPQGNRTPVAGGQPNPQQSQPSGAQGIRPTMGIIDTVDAYTLTVNVVAAQQSQQGAGAQAARGNTGQIESIEGNTLVLTNRATGNKTTVQVDSSTVYIRYITGTAADLTPGTTVTITGQAGADGVVAAANVLIGSPAQ